MAHLFINNYAASREIFLPGQVFVFGGFVLHANSISHQIRFGTLNYVTDVQGDLVYNEFLASDATLCPLQEDS